MKAKQVAQVFLTSEEQKKQIEEAANMYGPGSRNYSTWMRSALEFVLKLRRKAEESHYLVLEDSEGKEVWRVPVDVLPFLKK